MKRIKHKDKPEPKAETQGTLDARMGVAALMGSQISGAGASLPATVRTPHGWRTLKKKR